MSQHKKSSHGRRARHREQRTGDGGNRLKTGRAPGTCSRTSKRNRVGGNTRSSHRKDTRLRVKCWKRDFVGILRWCGRLFIGPLRRGGWLCYAQPARDAGIVITASHNPYDANGIKFSARRLQLDDRLIADSRGWCQREIETSAQRGGRQRVRIATQWGGTSSSSKHRFRGHDA